MFTLYAALIYKHVADLHTKMWKTTHFAIRSDVEGSAAWSSKYGLGPGEDMPVVVLTLNAYIYTMVIIMDSEQRYGRDNLK